MKFIANSLQVALISAAADPRTSSFGNPVPLPYDGVDDSATGTNGVSGALIDYSTTPAMRCKAVVADANYAATHDSCTGNEAAGTYCWSEFWQYTLTLEAGEYCYIDYNDFGNFMIGLNGTACNTGLTAAAPTDTNVLTLTYSTHLYDAGVDQTNIFSQGVPGCLDDIEVGSANIDQPITIDTADSSTWFKDFRGDCDTKVLVVAPAAISAA